MDAMETRRYGGLSLIFSAWLATSLGGLFLQGRQKYIPEAWIAEEIPRPSNGTPRFEDGVFEMWEFGLYAICGVNTRDPSTNNDHVEMSIHYSLGINGAHDENAVRPGIKVAAQFP
jgi:hypothetical protein